LEWDFFNKSFPTWCHKNLFCLAGGRVLVSLLGYPNSCVYNGGLHACTFSLACWLVGGQFQRGCGGPGWLVTCCVPARISVRTDIPGPHEYNDVALRNNPYRREHDESNELTPVRKIGIFMSYKI
jgi:hypothetical protein